MALGGGSTQSDIDVVVGGDASELNAALGSGMQKLSKFKAAVGAAGAAMAGFAGAAIGKSIKAAAGFDAKMTESLAIMGDVSSAMREDMSEAAREVGRTTQFSAEQAAESFYFLASAGLDAAESTKALGDMAAFAQAGQFDMAKATDILTDAASALNMEVEEYGGLADRLVKANTLANASVEQFGTALMNKAAPAMQRLGVETNEGIAALATFADQGLKGERAGTILARTLGGLESQARNNSKAFEDLGVEVFNSEGEMNSLTSIIGQLEEGLSGMSTEQRNAALEQMGFNRRAMQGIDLMMGNSEAMAEYTQQLGEAGGTAQEVADKQLQTLNKQWGLLKDNLLDVGITIGNVFLPYLTDMMSGIVSAVQRFAEWNEKMEGLPATITLVSAVVGGLITAVWGLSGAIGTALIPSLSSLAMGLGMLLGPFAAVAAAVGGLAYAWKTDFAGIREQTGYLIDKINGPFGEAMHQLEGLVTSVTSTFRSAWERSTSRVEAKLGGAVSLAMYLLGEKLRGIIISVIDILGEFRVAWSMNSQRIEDAIVRVLTTFGQLAEAAYRHLGPLITFIRDTFAATFESAFNSAVEIGRDLFDIILDLGTRFGIFGEDVTTLSEMLGQLLDPFRKVELAVDGLDQGISTLSTGWTEDWASIRTTTQESAQRLSELFAQMDREGSGSFTSIRESINQQLLSGIQRMREEWLSLSTTWTTELTNMGTGMQETFGLLWRILEEIVIPVASMITQVMQKHMGRMLELARVHLGPLIAEFMQTFNHINQNIIQPILRAILKFWNAFGDEILTVAEVVFDSISLVITNVMDIILTTIRVVLALIRGDWKEALGLILDLVKRMFGRVIDFAKEWGGRFIDWVAGLIGDVIQWFKDLAYELIGGSIIPQMFSDILGALKSFASDFISDLAGWASDVISDVETMMSDALAKITGAFSDWLTAGGDLVGELKSGITGAVSKLKNAIGGMMGKAKDKITSFKSKFKSAGKSLGSSLASGLTSAKRKAASAARSVASSIRDKFNSSDAEEGPLSTTTDAGAALPETLASGMMNELRSVDKAARRIAEEARPGLEGEIPDIAQRAPAPRPPREPTKKVEEGDEVLIDVTIEGDADADDVEHGIGSALRAYGVDRS